MKNPFIFLSALLLLGGCTTQSGSLSAMLEDSAESQEYQADSVPATLSSQANDVNAAVVPEVEASRYLHNVARKAQGEDFVTYEYKNIRVDEVAALAVRYCEEHGGKKAYLRQITLHQNHNRTATFDCKNLAMDQ